MIAKGIFVFGAQPRCGFTASSNVFGARASTLPTLELRRSDRARARSLPQEARYRCGCALAEPHLGALSLYVRFNHACGTGTMQMFIDRLSVESIADWIWIFVLSALNVGWM